MNIKEHFDGVKAKHQELIAKTESKKADLKEKVAAKTEEAKQLNKERKKKEDLMRQNQEAGLDTGKLQEMIQELDAKLSKVHVELTGFQTKLQGVQDVLELKFDREDLMVSVLKDQYRCEEAVVVDSLEECFKTLLVEVTQLDHAGHPEQCMISIGQERKALNIKISGKHFSKDFRPESLTWLPIEKETQQEWHRGYGGDTKALWRHPKQVDKRVLIFFDSKADKFILSKKLDWHQDVWNRNYDRDESKHFEDDFADIAIPLGAKIDTLLLGENAELDLEKSYKDNPLLAHARAEVLAQTNPKPLFKESSEKLSSPEIYKRIKTEWDSFVNCPWSSEINGTLALLKYHSENGEKARFWSGEFEGQYGFRLRTRDHSWIEGDIYILPAADADSKKDSVKMVHYRNYSHSLGRLFLTVKNVRDESQ